ncbi:MAG TPA: hypothetical protein VFE62_12130 [Gemmataceae bacterium]|nr:hypothetical protein [Gemmataceae bacterium]
MKRFHWWTLFGVSGAGLLAALLGPTVWGQPEPRIPLPTPPGLSQPAPLPAKLEELAPILPMADAPKEGVIGTVTEPLSSEPAPPVKKELAPIATMAEKVVYQAVSFDVPPGRQQPSVSVEWVSPTGIRIHQPMPCQILVRNNSKAPAQNVIVRHRLGQGVVVKGCEPQAINEGGELVWSLGTLAPEQSRRIDLTLIANARGPMNCHAVVTFTTVAGHLVQVREPQLAIKMRAPQKTIVGENVTLLVAISNPGDGVAESVKVKTMLPEGLEHPRGRIVEFDVGSLAPKEIKTMQLTCVARGTGAQKAMIVATGEGNLTSNDSASVEILIPRIDIAMTGPKLRYLQRHAVYTLKVTNPGSAPASNVEVQELIPAGFKLHQVHGGKYHEGTRMVSWTIAELAPGKSKELSVDLIPTEIGEHRLIAHAKTPRGLKSEAEVRTIVEGLPSLEMEVTHLDDPIEVGAQTAYEIRVANKGTKTETNVEVVCTMPEQLEFVNAKCTTTLRYRQEGRNLVFEKLPRLAPRAEVIFRVQVKGIAPGDIRFQTRIRADGLKDPVLREESTRIYSDEMPQKSTPTVQPTPFTVPTPMSVTPAPTPVPTPVSEVPPTQPILPTPAAPAPMATPTIPTPTPPVTTPTIPMPTPTVPGPMTTPTVPTPGASPLPAPTIPTIPAPTAGPANVPPPGIPAPMPN